MSSIAPDMSRIALETLLGDATVGLALIDASSEILHASRGFANMLGYDENELIGRLVFDLIHSDHVQLAHGALDQIVAKQVKNYAVERRYVHKNGSTVWVLVTVSTCKQNAADGRPIYIAQFTPIGKQKQAEARAVEALERWNFALESANQGVWDFDFGTDTAFLSLHWRRMRGIAETDDAKTLLEAWPDQIHPDDRDHVMNHIAQVNAGELTDMDVEYRERHPDGHWIWFLSRGRVIEWFDNGRAKRLIGTDTDISAIKRSEAEARELADREMRWKIAVESADQGVWDYHVATGEWFLSPGWKRLRGIPEDEEVSSDEKSWLKSVHPNDRGRVREFLKRQNSGELSDIDYEFRERHRDGRWVWILARGRVVERQADGKASRIIGTDTDITHFKENEIELADLHGRLELALSASQVGVWENDFSVGHAYWDDRTREIYGIDPSVKIITSAIWEGLLHPDDRIDTIAKFAAAACEGGHVATDFRIIVNQSEIRYVRCQARYHGMGADNGRMVGVSWDVTPDYMNAEALRQANALAEQRNVQLEAARSRMEFDSLHDALTGLPNRRWLDDKLANLGLDRRPDPIALLHIDLDRFKQINDTLGHAAGDVMLRHVAQLLRESVRSNDAVARIGGDEFVVLLSPPPLRRELDALVDRIINRAQVPLTYEGHECRSGVSVGVAVSSGGIDTKQLLINADIALYRAKNEGRNRAVFFTGALQAEIISNKRCADDLLQALERGEFVTYYQPQFEAGSFDISGAEALVRWQHPTRGLLLPDQFLGVAEELNVVSEIDHFVLETALTDQKIWQEAGLMVPKVSVNVSARRLRDETLIDRLKRLSIKRGTISFELLESIFLDEREDVGVWNVDRIKDLGIDIDIDDFGTGHASIVSLLKLSPRRLKIDRQLVAPIVESERQRQLVRSIVEIGRSQGIEVCAEGVETAAHVRILQDFRCDQLQGYYFARPMPAHDLLTFLKTEQWRRAS